MTNESLEAQLIQSLISRERRPGRSPSPAANANLKPRKCGHCQAGRHGSCKGSLRAKHGTKLSCQGPRCANRRRQVKIELPLEEETASSTRCPECEAQAGEKCKLEPGFFHASRLLKRMREQAAPRPAVEKPGGL